MTDSKTLNMARARKIRISKLVSTAIPIAVLAVPGTAFAQQAVNTATITAPTGAIESNLANNSAIDTDNVLARIVVTNDSTSGAFGIAGATAVLNVLANDTFNTGAATIADVTLSVASSSSLPAQLTFDPSTGDVGVVAGTSAGTYSFFYTICETANPTNCVNAEVTVTVVAAAILADPDSVSGVNGASGATGVVNVLDGDTLGGVQVALADVDISVVTEATPNGLGDPVPTLNTATGLVDVPANTPAGTYTITYEICESLNPTNCAQNTVTIEVDASPIVATNDTVSGVNGTTGAALVVNVLSNDTVNTVSASTSNATLALAAGETVPAGLTFDETTGNVGVAAGTPGGTYSFDYEICEALNPTNCQTATVSVTVTSLIEADPDSVTGVNGASGATGVVNVLDGDTLNGSQATLADVDISVITAATPNNPGDPVPVLDPATGLVDVPAGTPAGTYTIDYQVCETINPTNCSTNTATITVAPSVDLSVTKDNGTTAVRSGDTITYSITVSNAGPDAATGAVLTDTPGAGITCPTTNPLAFSGVGAPVAGPFTVDDLVNGGITLGSIGNGQSLTVTYNCTVN